MNLIVKCYQKYHILRRISQIALWTIETILVNESFENLNMIYTQQQMVI